MRFPQAHQAEQDHIGALFDELQAEDVSDLQWVDFLGPVETEVIQGLDHWKTGGLDAADHGTVKSQRSLLR